MDEIDKNILSLLKGNARMTYQELGGKLGMSRVAAKKRVKKLEEGIIRGYNTTIYRDDEATMLMDIETSLEGFDPVLEYSGSIPRLSDRSLPRQCPATFMRWRLVPSETSSIYRR